LYLFSADESLTDSAKRVFHRLLRKFRRVQSRVVRGKRRRNTVLTTATGRAVRPVEYDPERSVLAPVQTVISSVRRGAYDLRSKKLRIRREDFVGWQHLEHESLTLVLLVDVSRSTFPYINVFSQLLRSFTGYFNRNNDRIGLISLQGAQAKILNHPTHNYRVISKSLSTLRIHGETPLADGLLKALYMARLERFKKPGSRSVVILLSDCYPEPLTHHCEDIFEEPMYRETVARASLYKRDKVFLLVINPSFENTEEENLLPGERLSEMVAKVSGGKLIKLFVPKGYSAGEKLPSPSRHEIQTILKGIEETFSQLRIGISVQ